MADEDFDPSHGWTMWPLVVAVLAFMAIVGSVALLCGVSLKVVGLGSLTFLILCVFASQ